MHEYLSQSQRPSWKTSLKWPRFWVLKSYLRNTNTTDEGNANLFPHILVLGRLGWLDNEVLIINITFALIIPNKRGIGVSRVIYVLSQSFRVGERIL